MNAFLQALLNIIQLWTQALPINVLAFQTNDFINGLLIFFGTSLNNMANGQAAPNPLGNGIGNGLINFWHNLDSLLNPAQTPQIAGVIQQGFINQNTINQLQTRINQAILGGAPLQPTAPEMVAALKVIVGLFAIQAQTTDPRYRWALLFLLFWTLTQGFYNPQDAQELYSYLFLNGGRPARVMAIGDPIIVRLLPGGGPGPQPWFGQGNCGCCAERNPFLPNNCGQQCPDIFWKCNPTDQCCCDCVQRQKPCACQCDPCECRKQKPCACQCDPCECRSPCRCPCDDDCIFPKATCFLFERLGQEAKSLLQCGCTIDWCALSCVLKKMLVLAMFAGKKKKKCNCGGQCGGKCGGQCTGGCICNVPQWNPCDRGCDCGGQCGGFGGCQCGGNFQGGWRW